MVDATAPPRSAPVRLKNAAMSDGLPRRQDFGRNDGRNGVGRVVKTVAVFKDDRRQDDDEKSDHAGATDELRSTSNDLEDDVAGVAAAIDHLFQQLVKIAQKDDVLGVVITVVKIAQ